MRKLLHYKFVVPLIILVVISLACNIPTSAGTALPDVTSELSSQYQQENTSQSSTATHLPTQALPRPTHQFDQSSLPKPTPPVPPSQTTRQPQSQVAAQPTADQQTYQSGDSGDFFVTNLSSSVICYYFMAFSTDNQWGNDRLGEQGVVKPDETFTITGLPYGTYDAQALDCDGNVLGEVYGFDFPPSDMFSLTD